jgi:hypothetical protein
MKAKLLAFRVLLAALCLAGAGMAAEQVLRYRLRAVTGQERLDPGLFIYDATLGWRLKSNWKGAHRHHDYDVRYTLDRQGFRYDPAGPARPTEATVMVLGDSFSFALGANDDEVFTHLLNRAPDRPAYFLNRAVPGYSTDQEALQLDAAPGERQPAHLLLVTYLPNDLIDNMLPFPIQADNGKPYFELEDDEPVLRNVPVPRTRKQPGPPEFDLVRALLGERHPSLFRVVGNLHRYELGRPVAQWLLRRRALPAEFEAATRDSLRLYQALIEKIGKRCRADDIAFTLALLPGRSLVEQPGSLSARYQEYLREQICAHAFETQPRVVDLATALREAKETGAPRLYFPHDGHLAPAGHRAVAERLAGLDWVSR